MKKTILLLLFIGINIFCNAQNRKTINYKASDGLSITADLYLAHAEDATFVILFHRANWSRGEYIEIAPKLNALGYNCMAVDQRSGGEINNIVNQTKLEAIKIHKETRYIDAYIDILSSINYIKTKFPKAKIVILGSSYSSALVLRLCGDYPDLIDGVLAFSPGEYFENQGKTASFIQEGAKNIKVPVFISSAKSEKVYWEEIYNIIPSTKKHFFLPEREGKHGSRVLWTDYEDSQAYWTAVKDFLKLYF